MSLAIDNLQKRIESIDILRGIVMVFMALDHVRDYFHIYANTDDPLNLGTTTPALFFTRWITHFCAPIFILLTGASVYLQSLRKTKRELSIFLIQRGLWLIFAEFVIIAFAWTFNPYYIIIPMQVIWAIGISMVILGFAIHLPYRVILSLGLLIVLSHNLLDFPESMPGFQAGFWWDLFHHGVFKMYPIFGNHNVMMVYPFVTWTGVMMIGYGLGKYYSPDYNGETRRKNLTWMGISLIVFFIGLRYLNIYGDPQDWSQQRTFWFSIFSFINTDKYPPFLLFLCMTIGPALILLSFLEKFKNQITDVFKTFGRVAFFYYILHLYLIHLVAMICFFIAGHNWAEAANVGKMFPFLFVTPGEGFQLGIVYVIWLGVVLLLYPFCLWYDKYKTRHKEKWWLSYL